jgi:hypothetical protein
LTKNIKYKLKIKLEKYRKCKLKIKDVGEAIKEVKKEGLRLIINKN